MEIFANSADRAAGTRRQPSGLSACRAMSTPTASNFTGGCRQKVAFFKLLSELIVLELNAPTSPTILASLVLARVFIHMNFGSDFIKTVAYSLITRMQSRSEIVLHADKIAGSSKMTMQYCLVYHLLLLINCTRYQDLTL